MPSPLDHSIAAVARPCYRMVTLTPPSIVKGYSLVMPLRSAELYVEALRDGRSVFYQGRRVPDVTLEPDLRVAIDHASLDFQFAHNPMNQSLAVAQDEVDGPYSAYYRLPRTADDLLNRMALIEATTAVGGTMVTL